MISKIKKFKLFITQLYNKMQLIHAVMPSWVLAGLFDKNLMVRIFFKKKNGVIGHQ